MVTRNFQMVTENPMIVLGNYEYQDLLEAEVKLRIIRTVIGRAMDSGKEYITIEELKTLLDA